jgi:hypothetical protein
MLDQFRKIVKKRFCLALGMPYPIPRPATENTFSSGSRQGNYWKGYRGYEGYRGTDMAMFLQERYQAAFEPGPPSERRFSRSWPPRPTPDTSFPTITPWLNPQSSPDNRSLQANGIPHTTSDRGLASREHGGGSSISTVLRASQDNAQGESVEAQGI